MCKVYFIDGPDYSGKTTLIHKIYSHFVLKSKKVAILKEPDGDIRKILLDKDGDYSYSSRRCLFAADHFNTLDTIYKIKDKYDYIFIDRCAIASDVVYSFNEDVKDKKTRNFLCLLLNQYDMVDELEYNDFFKKNSNLILLNLSEQELMKRIEQRAVRTDDIFDIKGNDYKIKITKQYQILSNKILKGDNIIGALFNNISSINVDDDLLDNVIAFIEGCDNDV